MIAKIAYIRRKIQLIAYGNMPPECMLSCRHALYSASVKERYMSLENGKSRLSIYLRMLREDNHKTQAQLADMLGISRQNYSHYETGRIVPPVEAISKISEYYNIPIDRFIKFAVTDIRDTGRNDRSSYKFFEEVIGEDKNAAQLNEGRPDIKDSEAFDDFLLSMQHGSRDKGDTDVKELLFYYNSLSYENREAVKRLVKRFYITEKKGKKG
jgi:transcriptional regulator with XRE-family HTH domain